MPDRNTSIRFAVKEENYHPPIDQIEAFIKKVRAEIAKGDLPKTVGENLISRANNLKYMVKN